MSDNQPPPQEQEAVIARLMAENRRLRDEKEELLVELVTTVRQHAARMEECQREKEREIHELREELMTAWRRDREEYLDRFERLQTSFQTVVNERLLESNTLTRQLTNSVYIGLSVFAKSVQELSAEEECARKTASRAEDASWKALNELFTSSVPRSNDEREEIRRQCARFLSDNPAADKNRYVELWKALRRHLLTGSEWSEILKSEHQTVSVKLCMNGMPLPTPADVYIDEESLNAYARDVLAHLPLLEVLTLRGIPSLETHCFPWIRNLKQLTTLQITSTPYTIPDLFLLLDMVPTLTKLSVSLQRCVSWGEYNRNLTSLIHKNSNGRITFTV